MTLGLAAIGAMPSLPVRAAVPSAEASAAESGNALDDAKADTTGTEAVTMFRLYNPNSGEHFYTKDESEQTDLVKEG